MKRVNIRNLEGIITHSADFSDPQPWIDEQLALGSWGNSDNFVIEILDLDQDADYQLEQIHRKRRSEYPYLEECVEALFEHLTEDRSDKLDELIAKRAAIKAKYPKP